ncbi:MAG TPA: response regulator transcription factor [Anaerolineales bacterium]|nr:response regulator transcription factor [Anaerolineales bacterium]
MTPLQATHSDTLRILIADDTAETRRTLRIMLSLDEKLEVVAVAENGLQAVELADLQKPDIALVDINMPGLNGIEAIKRMLANDPGLICTVISTEQDSQTLYAAMAAGAREYLIKPFTMGELELVISKVRKLMEEREHTALEVEQHHKQREGQLRTLKFKAREAILARRTDAETVQILEDLASEANCEEVWLMNLGIVYILRKEWGKVGELAERVEKTKGTAFVR